MLTHIKAHWWKYLAVAFVIGGVYWYWKKMYCKPQTDDQTKLEKAAAGAGN